MADQDLSHTADIIKAAIPFVDSNLKGLAELFAKLLDLLGSLKTTGILGKNGISGITSQISASGFQLSKIDIEGLLKGVRPVCDKKERDIVDQILNIFNMKRTFEMYNNMMSTMQAMQEAGGFNFGDGSTNDDTENVTGNFSGANFESIFKTFSNGFGSSNSNNASENSDSTMNESPFYQTEPVKSEETTTSDSPKNTSSNSDASESPMNNKMFDMLKAMIPPEQKGTFENLSMLLNNMSYDDNNSKPDDDKECNNG